MANKLTGDALAVKKMAVALKATGLFSPKAIEMIRSGEVSDRKIVEAVDGFREEMYPADLPVSEEYVIGVAVDPDRTHVLVIEKNRPAWQVGKLNFPGGKIEDGETPEEAIVREFREETGVETDLTPGDDVPTWVRVGVKHRPALVAHQDRSYRVHVFAIELDLSTYRDWIPKTGEPVMRVPLNVELLRRRGVAGVAGIADLAIVSLHDGSFFDIQDPPIMPDDDDAAHVIDSVLADK